MEATARSVAKHDVLGDAGRRGLLLPRLGGTRRQAVDGGVAGRRQFAEAGQFDLAEATEYLAELAGRPRPEEQERRQVPRQPDARLDVLVRANTLANASVQQFAEALTDKAAAGCAW